jgi:hypothetical protein
MCIHFKHVPAPLRQSGKPKYGITHDHRHHSFGLSTQYYVLCSTVGRQPTTHSILHRSALVDISKGDGNFSHTSSLIRLGPGYLLQPSRHPMDCRDLIMFTHSLEFLYRDTRMRRQDPKCCFWQQLVPRIAPICLETWWHTFFVLQPAAHTTCTCDNPWIYICRVTAV